MVRMSFTRKPTALLVFVATLTCLASRVSTASPDLLSANHKGDACDILGCSDPAEPSVVLGTTTFQIVFAPSQTSILSGDAGNVQHVLGHSTTPEGFPEATLDAIRIKADTTTATFVMSDATTFLLPRPTRATAQGLGGLGATASWEIVSKTVTHVVGPGYSVVLATPSLSFVTFGATGTGALGREQTSSPSTRTEVITMTKTLTSTVENVKTIIETLVSFDYLLVSCA